MTIKQFLEFNIIDIGKYTLSVYDIMVLSIFLIVSYFGFRLIKTGLRRTSKLDSAKTFAITKLIQYVVVVIVFLGSLQILGFNISVLLAGSAALLVGIGFGLQNLFNDFFSGVVILLDGTLKVGDIIEVDDTIYKVLEINFRTTKVIGRNDDYIILPNSILTANKIINWTLEDVSSRFKIEVGVDYASDIELVMRILQESAAAHPLVLKSPKPFVRFEDYADSALIFCVYFFSDEIFRAENTKSDIRVVIFKALKKNGVNIPFPQRVVHYAKGKEVE